MYSFPSNSKRNLHNEVLSLLILGSSKILWKPTNHIFQREKFMFVALVSRIGDEAAELGWCNKPTIPFELE
jgi:hypothetical protein